MTVQTIALSATAILSFAAALPLTLPRHVTVERHATIAAAPEAVLALAASNSGYQRFNPYRDSDPNLKIETFGPESGVGSGFTFNSKDGEGQQVVAAVTPDQVTFDIDLGPMGRPVQAISAVKQDGITQVTWRMEMDLGHNPIARVMGLFMDRMIGQTFERGLANIAEVTA